MKTYGERGLLVGWVLLVGLLAGCLLVNASLHTIVLSVAPTDSAAWLVWLMLGVVVAEPILVALGLVHLKLSFISRGAFALAAINLCCAALVFGSISAITTANLSSSLHVRCIAGILALWLCLLICSLLTIKLSNALVRICTGFAGRSIDEHERSAGEKQSHSLVDFQSKRASIGGLLLLTGLLATAFVPAQTSLEGEWPSWQFCRVAAVIVVACMTSTLWLQQWCRALLQQTSSARGRISWLVWPASVMLVAQALMTFFRHAMSLAVASERATQDAGRTVSAMHAAAVESIHFVTSPGHVGLSMLLLGMMLVHFGVSLAIRRLDSYSGSTLRSELNFTERG